VTEDGAAPLSVEKWSSLKPKTGRLCDVSPGRVRYLDISLVKNTYHTIINPEINKFRLPFISQDVRDRRKLVVGKAVGLAVTLIIVQV
jgi:hypothetical protein